MNKSKKRKTILINKLRGYGISLIDDELTTIMLLFMVIVG
ncbi:hypothetical protein [Lactobacillus amylovorus]